MLHKLPYFTDTHKYYYITYIKSDSKISKKKTLYGMYYLNNISYWITFYTAV